MVEHSFSTCFVEFIEHIIVSVPYYRRHQEVDIMSDNFLLGETETLS